MQTKTIKNPLILFALLGAAACSADNTAQQAQNQNANRTVTNAAASNRAASTGISNAADITILKEAPEVPYVPTHEMVVDEMLKMAEVKGSVVLWDLGSGDGRIPVTAARRFGTRGVGVDIDPQRVKEANENAKNAGVTDKVQFLEEDLFEVDFSEATVVSLYLLPEVNLRLRAKLINSLKPGTRVVSHNYDMGNWHPKDVKIIKTPDGVEHIVYLWQIPQNKNELKESLK
jgi:hypothetical protein